MDCKECKERMNDALDSQLGEKEAEFNYHLDTCDECKKEYEEYQIMMQAIHDLPDIELPEGFRNRWKEAVKEEEKGMLAVLPLHKRRGIRVAMGIAAAALIAINMPTVLQMGNNEMLKDEAPMEMAMEENEEELGAVFADEPMMSAMPASDEEKYSEEPVTSARDDVAAEPLENASPEMAVLEEIYFIQEKDLVSVQAYFEQKEIALAAVEENVYIVQLDADGLSSWESFISELGDMPDGDGKEVDLEETPPLVEIRAEIIE